MRACGSREEKSAPLCARGWGALFGSSFCLFFSSPWACPMQIGLRRERCPPWSPRSGPRAFLWPPSALFSPAFPSLSFSHRHFGLLPYSNYLTEWNYESAWRKTSMSLYASLNDHLSFIQGKFFFNFYYLFIFGCVFIFVLLWCTGLSLW